MKQLFSWLRKNNFLNDDAKNYTDDELLVLYENTNQSSVIESNNIKLNKKTLELTTACGVSYVLPKKEFDLLHYLIINKNNVMLRKDILRDVWGTDVIVDHRTIDVHVRKIRKKINKSAHHLMTRKCYGFIWVEEN